MPTYNCTSYNCDDDLGSHTLNDCGDVTRGGYPNVILLECDNDITDPSDATEVQAAIDDGTAHLVKNVKLAIPVGSPIKVDSQVANAPQLIVKYEYAGTMIDQNVSSANVTFYNNLLDGRSFGGIILHNAEEGKVYWHDAEVRFEGGLVMPDNDGEVERFETTFSFKKLPSATVPTIYTEPAGIFT